MQIKKSPIFLDLFVWISEMKMKKRFSPDTQPNPKTSNTSTTILYIALFTVSTKDQVTVNKIYH